MTYRIDRLFGSKTRVAMLSKILSNPDKKYYLRELANELNMPYSMLYKEKDNLAKLGIITEEKKGRINLVAVNRSLPYFAELKALIAKTAGVGGVLRASLAGLTGVKYAAVYGSFASGEESASSDVDLLIVGDAEEEEVLRAAASAEKSLGREVNYILWSEKEFNSKVKSGHHLITDIEAKPVIMVAGDEREFRRAAKG